MNGPEHYREAERLLTIAEAGQPAHLHASVVAEAQVHATLALAAATAAPQATAYDGDEYGARPREWAGVA